MVSCIEYLQKLTIGDVRMQASLVAPEEERTNFTSASSFHKTLNTYTVTSTHLKIS